MNKTIQTKFDPKSLPRWAQNHPAVVELAKRDLAYRCDVCDAKTKQMRDLLIRKAER